MQDDLEVMQGRWRVVEAVRDGTRLSDAEAQSVACSFGADGRALVFKAGAQIFEGTFRLDPTQEPKAEDVTQTSPGPLQGTTLHNIYALEGDTLTICSPAPGAARPTEFTAEAGSGRFLRVFRREHS